MITVKGLEEKLRKLKVWTLFQRNKPNIDFACSLAVNYKDAVLLSFLKFNFQFSGYSKMFSEPKEGQDFWNKIADKIDEVKL